MWRCGIEARERAVSACAGAVRRPRNSRRGKVLGGVAGRRSSNGAAARRGDDGERVPWRAACALEWGSDGKAQQGSSAAAAGSASTCGSGAASASVRTRALCARGVNAERRKGEREWVLWSTILTRFEIKIFML